jgi:hypothetical protein
MTFRPLVAVSHARVCTEGLSATGKRRASAAAFASARFVRKRVTGTGRSCCAAYRYSFAFSTSVESTSEGATTLAATPSTASRLRSSQTTNESLHGKTTGSVP